MSRPRIAIVSSHAIQYNAPWFRAVAERADLVVFYAHRQSAQQQAAAGYGVEFEWDIDVTSGYPFEYLVNVSGAPSVERFSGCDTPEVGARLLEHRPDAVVVLGWNLKTYWQAARAARAAGIPVFVRGDSQLSTPRSTLLRAMKRIAYPIRLRGFDGFLPVGIRSLEYLLHYGVSPARCTICPHTIDVRRFAAAATSAAGASRRLRVELGIAQARIAMFVGRLVDWKRPSDLVRAAAAAGSRGTACVFVGAGEQAEAVAALARKLDVTAVFAGFRNQRELPAWYALADVLVVPSTARETWGLVANEAIASGTPVIASDQIGCAPDLAALGPCLRTFPGGDVASLARALDRVEPKREGHPSASCLEAAAAFAPEVAADALIRAIARR